MHGCEDTCGRCAVEGVSPRAALERRLRREAVQVDFACPLEERDQVVNLPSAKWSFVICRWLPISRA